MSVLAAIAVLALLIVVHELGHFAAARLQGIHVNRFSIGFGPALAKYQGAETEYAVRAIPLGGYVGFPDDDPETEIPADDPNLLRNRPILDRAIVISAGVIANLVFAYFLLVGQAATIGFQDMNYQPGVAIPEILAGENSAAVVAGIEPGDVILAVDSQKLEASPTAIMTLRETIQQSPNQPLVLTIQREEKTLNLTVTPTQGADGKGKIGVILTPNGEAILRKADNFFEAFTLGATEYQRLADLTTKGFWQLVSNFKENAQQVAGPVKIVEYGATIAQNNAGNLLQFAAIISINLAIINILPLPALDGGQLVFLGIEALRGKPLPLKVQEGIMQTGLVLLLGLGVVLIVRDTLNLAIFQKLFQ
ncbi:membrane-associated zinc metalloprotease [Gloeothece citriformis PCC 7424]|uniref:Zinc metalloprotease n=1 Tax=Gloeothece citriformis (strain PCC 7424) TaxID=65393 RepID=B7KI55_GLOC7|nr:RIP metalloprotease RseP [Gloeothece citriformis]ACK73542.1 membrane-associated zinc metalloprotease [Gloeothece citriformis PCC 7424]